MKKFLPYILILVVSVGLFGPLSTLDAQTTNSPEYADCLKGNPKQTCDELYGPQPTGPALIPSRPTIAPGATIALPATIAPRATVAPSPTSSGTDDCGLLSNWGQCIINGLTRIAFLILGIMSLILWLAGTLLDFVLDFTILKMAVNIKDMTGINIAWKIIRDLMNIVFIFLLVYEGIKMIIGQSDTGKVKTFITGVVLASLLINFSLFFTKVMIDASNIVTIGIYNSVIEDSSSESSTIAKVSGLSVPFMKALGVSDFYSATTFESMLNNAGGGTNLLVIALAGSVVFLIVSFVFLAVSAMFVVRYLTLLILLMLSPIAYMGMALPFMKGYASDWWKSLNGQLLFAPIYMIMTLIILTLMSSEGFISKEGNWGNLITNTGQAGAVAVNSNGSISLLFNFAVIIGLVIASLVIAKKTSTEGSKFISQATGNLTKFAGNTVMGGGGWLGRKSLGYIGKSAADSAALQETAAGKGGRGTNFASRMLARTALGTARVSRDATFDIRNASVPGLPNITPLGAYMAETTGVGKGGTEGYRKEKEASDKKKRDKEALYTAELTQSQAKRDIVAGKDAVVGSPEYDAMQKALAKMSDKQTETLVAGNRELLTSLNFANNISVKQLEALNKSDQFSDEEKQKIKDKRFEQIKTIHDPAALLAYTTASAVPVGVRTPDQIADIKRVDDARAKVRGLSDSELEMIDPAYFDTRRPEALEFISQLTGKQAEAITTDKNGKFTSTQKDNVKKQRIKPLMDALRSGVAVDVRREIRKADIKTMVGYMKLDGPVPGQKIALDPNVLRTYNVKTLQRMALHENMTDGDISTLRTAILGPTGTGAPGVDPATIAWLLDANKGILEFPA